MNLYHPITPWSPGFNFGVSDALAFQECLIGMLPMGGILLAVVRQDAIQANMKYPVDRYDFGLHKVNSTFGFLISIHLGKTEAAIGINSRLLVDAT